MVRNLVNLETKFCGTSLASKHDGFLDPVRGNNTAVKVQKPLVILMDLSHRDTRGVTLMSRRKTMRISCG